MRISRLRRAIDGDCCSRRLPRGFGAKPSTSAVFAAGTAAAPCSVATAIISEAWSPVRRARKRAYG